ncbi:MAG TPA: hypothetical protein VH912_33260 [Streptosporangiaceae bacterium]|jgi:hypothetical protein
MPPGLTAAARWTAGALGVALMAFGTYVLLTDAHIHDPQDVVLWLAGAIAVHDGVLAPLVLAVGLALGVVVRPAPSRWIVRGALMVAGCLTLVALPNLLPPGRPTNITVLPLDYLTNWLLLLAIIIVFTATVLAVLNRRPRRPRSAKTATRCPSADRPTPPAP